VVRFTIDSDSLENVSPVLHDVSMLGYNAAISDLPHALLHEATKDDVTVRLRPRYYVCLVVFSMTHYIFGDMGCSCKKDLSSGVVTLFVLHTLESSRTITRAVEDDLG